MAFIELSEAANRLGVSISDLRDLIERMDRIPRVRFLDPKKDFWSDDGLVDEQDIKTYEQVLRQRRFVRFREKFSDVVVHGAELSCRPGWKSLLERVAERLRWMPPEWSVRLLEAREKSGYLVLKFEHDRDDRRDAFNEIARLSEEMRLASLALCEECGRNGRFRYSPSRSLTLCDRHARLAEPTLPGDGEIADPASAGASTGELPSD